MPKTLTAEHRARISEGLQGNTNCFGRVYSKASIQKMKQSHTGLKDTDETKRAKSLAQKGVPKSPEARRNIVAARRKRASEERLRIRLPKSRSNNPRPVWCVIVYSDTEPRYIRMMPLHEAEHPLASLYQAEWLHYLALDNYDPRIECVYVGYRENCVLRVEELEQQYEQCLYKD